MSTSASTYISYDIKISRFSLLLLSGISSTNAVVQEQGDQYEPIFFCPGVEQRKHGGGESGSVPSQYSVRHVIRATQELTVPPGTNKRLPLWAVRHAPVKELGTVLSEVS